MGFQISVSKPQVWLQESCQKLAESLDAFLTEVGVGGYVAPNKTEEEQNQPIKVTEKHLLVN